MFIPLSLLTSSFNISKKSSTPTESINPDCSCPKISPAPLIDKSLIAIENPLPSSVNSLITLSLFLATSDSILPLLYIKYE